MNLSEELEERALRESRALLAREVPGTDFHALCRWLRHGFPRYGWVGVYLLEGGTLHLAGWDGEHPTEHTSIPLGSGLCGLAAREQRTVNVRDVRERPEYLACFLETRSEIVVPIMDGATCLGEIDIDGPQQGAYDASDERFLERLSKELVHRARSVLERAPWRA